MIQFSEDPNFHYEAIRSIGLSRYFGGDINEQILTVAKIKPGDIESWYREWNSLARRVLATIDESKPESYSAVTLRDVYLRASHYFFVSDFFLHGNQADPRIAENYNLWHDYFVKANALFTNPGKYVTLPTEHGFDISLIIYRAAGSSPSNPRPTILIAGGFDSNIEECYHWLAYPALERGYNVVLYEGPGQHTCLQKQKKGFIYDWEKSVTPIVDYLLEQNLTQYQYMDTSKLALVGMSLGGYLAARAAAFEPRLAAVFLIDGVMSFFECVMSIIPEAKEAYHKGDAETFNKFFEGDEKNLTTAKRWFRDHLKYSFQTETGYEAFKFCEKMTMEGIAHQINMPAFVGYATEDLFFADQPERVAKAIGDNATLFRFGPELGAHEHCQSAATAYLGQAMYEWFAEVIGEKNK